MKVYLQVFFLSIRFAVMKRSNNEERQCIPDECVERFIHLGGDDNRMWPHHEVDVAGLSRVVAGYEIERWAFSYHVALIVTNGELMLSHDGVTQRVSAGQFVFMPARVRILYRAEMPCEIIWLHLVPENEFWRKFSGLEIQVQKTRNARKLASLMEYLYDENVVPDAGNSVIQQLLCQLILQYLREDLMEMIQGKPLRPQLEECFRMVGEAPEHFWQISTLCRMAGMSRAAFFVACRQEYGRAPMALVRQIRLNAAARLLVTSDATLDDVASQTGFDCGFSLSRAFRKEYGCAPGHWRSLHRKGEPLLMASD